MKKLLSLLLIVALMGSLTVGCSSDEAETADTAATTTDDSSSSEDTADSATPAKTVDENWGDMTWDEVLAEAEGQTVNWYMWGGSTTINTFVSDEIAAKAKEYGVTLNPVGVTSIAEAINKVLGEKTAGKDTGGEVDLIWINGANFMTMKQADVLFGNWSEDIEHAAYVDWTVASIANDMGFPVEGHESPWAKAQFQLIYDSANYSEAELPHNAAELMEWAAANPGRFTYPALPDFKGTRFVKTLIYELTGGYEQYMRDDITKEEFAQMSAPAWEYLQELKPYLWREGESYPKGSAELNSLFSNSEVDYSITLSAGGIASEINSGVYSATSRVYALDLSMGDVNYVAIPYNSNAKAAAMVVANCILDPEIQAKGITDISFSPVLDNTTLPADELKIIEDAFATLPEGSFVPEARLVETVVPEVSGYLNVFIEELWVEMIGTN